MPATIARPTRRRRAAARYTVIVGNIGTVYDNTSAREAVNTYTEYRMQSNKGYGRAAGEPVTLLRNGELVAEHIPADTM